MLAAQVFLRLINSLGCLLAVGGVLALVGRFTIMAQTRGEALFFLSHTVFTSIDSSVVSVRHTVIYRN